jgi:quercetin dioxygenase-like cupin family protein
MRIDQPVTQAGPADWFTGEVWLDQIAAAESPSRLRALRVHFTPGARTAWHSHPVGQVLHVTEGTGRVQRLDGAITEIRAGDTVHAEPGEVHWHGAAPDSFMTHLAMQESSQDGTTTDWLDHVTDAEYQPDNITREHLLSGDLTARNGRIDRVEIHQVTLPPGQATGRHAHPGGVAGYVTSGRIAFEPDGHPAQELRTGSAFFEPAAAAISHFDNLSDSQPATFIACYLLTGDEPLIQPL